MTNPSKQRIKKFRKQIYDILTQELELRKDIRHLYDQFMLDIDVDKMAMRHVRQAYYSIQKRRILLIMKERFEFHPFFSANTIIEDLDEGSDDLL